MGLFISVVVNNLVINTVAIHTSTFRSGDYIPRDGFADSYGNAVLKFLRNSHTSVCCLHGTNVVGMISAKLKSK